MMLHALFLRDYRLKISIGIHDHERAAPQYILINIFLLVDLPIERDDIDQVVDYDFLRIEIARITGNGHFETQEALAGSILSLCRRNEAIKGVKVTTEKPDIYPDAAGVGCKMLWLHPTIDASSAMLLLG